MKNKLCNFLLAMGVPLTALGVQSSGCTGICGSCGLNCTPGVFMLLVLGCKFFYNKLKGRVMADV
ncbi:hypothetical protein [Phascolarctobacterium sp.]|uniref:hypothetical protein n=1 Tax=Phascolarctobacterium sp. TaxID=2049039 RepID=UPI003863FA12